MSYELRAILEYDAARREVIDLAHQISDSTCDNSNVFYSRKCKAETENPCFELLWDWNRKHLEYDRWNNSAFPYDEDSEEPELPEGEEPPELCECCKVTQSLVDARKEAKKRFGIAKTRLSRIAREHRKSTAPKAQNP